jgi:hypothetical protein
MLNNLRYSVVRPIKKYSYQYKRGANLSPGSDLHQDIVKYVFDRALYSYNAMNKRHSIWRDIDKNLTAFVPLDKEEARVKAEDERKPVSIVVPMSFYTLDTFLMYYAAEFLKYPLFEYEGQDPKDGLKGFLSTQLVSMDSFKAKLIVKLFIFFKDITRYGLGVLGLRYKKMFKTRNGVEKPSYDGNDYFNIDPYLYLPDPDVPIDEPTRGNFVGYVEETNYYSLLTEEYNDANGDTYNVKYLEDLPSLTGNNITANANQGRTIKYGSNSRNDADNKPIDIIHMYCNIIPKKLKLGKSDIPEWWLFSVSTSGVLIRAMPMDFFSYDAPVFVAAPDTDGYTIYPTSRIELDFGMQQAVDYFMSSHIHNQRKAANDMWLVDPARVNMRDLMEPGPGKMIRLRSDVWGGGIKDAIINFPVSNATASTMNDIQMLFDINNKFSGASDSISGHWRQGSERVSAAEARGTMQSALSRLRRVALLVEHQAILPLGLGTLENLQRFLGQSVWVKLTAEWVRYLSAEAYKYSKVKVSREDIDIELDIIPKVASSRKTHTDDPQAYIQAMQLASQDPEIRNEFSMSKMFGAVLDSLGITNLEDLKRTDIQVQAMPDEQLDAQTQQGNIAPAQEAL